MPGRISAAGLHSASPTNPHCPLTCCRLTNSIYRGNWEATDSDLKDEEQWGPSSSQKDFEAHASYLLWRGSARQGGLQEAKVSCCQHISPCPSPIAPRVGNVLTQDLLCHLMWPQDPGQSSRDHRRHQPGALCSPQTQARTIWWPVHKYMKYFITPDTKAKFLSKLNRYKSPENPALTSMVFPFFFPPFG